jgi:hypothetical protein
MVVGSMLEFATFLPLYMKEAIDNAYVSKDEKGIHLLREDIFIKAKTEFRKVRSAKPKEKLVIIMD